MKAPAWKTELDYDDTGTDATPVVLLHAFPLHRGMWEPQTPLARGARLIRYDLRGLGRTPLGGPEVPFELHVEDLFALLDHLKLRSAVLCGLSLGGYIALRAVERSPERVRALILCDTKSEADDDEAKLKRANGVLAIKRDGLDRYAEGFLPMALAPGAAAKKPALADRVRELIAANSPDGVCAALLAIAGRTDTTASLAKVRVPTLVVVGEEDGLTPPSAARALAGAIAGAKLALIPEAGHLSNLENPYAFNRAVGAFLEAVK